MESRAIWGKTFPKPYNYSEEGIEKFKKLIDLSRDYFKAQHGHETDHGKQIELGVRFWRNEDVLWALESNVKEEDFILDSENVLNFVLLGAAETDYYYSFEKQW